MRIRLGRRATKGSEYGLNRTEVANRTSADIAWRIDRRRVIVMDIKVVYWVSSIIRVIDRDRMNSHPVPFIHMHMQLVLSLRNAQSSLPNRHSLWQLLHSLRLLHHSRIVNLAINPSEVKDTLQLFSDRQQLLLDFA